MEYAIEIQHLSYTYNSKTKALDDISFKVPKGAIYGFLGQNGAGKSTTMRMLAGIIPDEYNAIKVLGLPISEQLPSIYRKVGCLVEQPVLYKHLTAFDHLEMIAKQNKIPLTAIDDTLSIIGLKDAKHIAVKHYSLGMKQRLAIGLCLIKSPSILLLDEPVNGLDPNGMLEVRELLLRLSTEQGVTVFISSHLLSEIEQMCTHICIINKGKIHFEGTMQALKENFDNTPVSIKTDKHYEQLRIEQFEITTQDNYIVCHVKSKEEISLLVQSLVAQNIPVYEVKQAGNLASWFMDIVD
jgi:ABC-type multidrug transport system ATPase subunit